MMITLCMGALCAHAIEPTDVSGMDYVVYMETTKAQVGSTVDIYLREKTGMKSGGFSTDLVLPEGITATATTNCGVAEPLIVKGGNADNGTYRVIYTVAVNETMVPAGTDDEMVKVTLSVANTVAAGDYAIGFTNTEIISETGAAGTMKRPADITCVLKVQEEPVYAEGFSLTTPAFCMPANVEYDEAATHANWLTLTATNARNVAKVSFDVELPTGMGIGTYVLKKKEYPDPYYAWDSTFEGEDVPDCTDNGDGTYSIEAEYDLAAGTKPWIALPLTAESTLAAGVYDVTVSNIVFTAANGHEYAVQDYVASVLCNVAGMSTLDVRSAKGLNALSIDVAGNPNLMIMAKAGQVANTKNVVVGGVCENLVLTDKYPFVLSEAITATTATYQRADITNYATLYLPFAFDIAEADFDAFAYDRVEGSKMYYEPVPTVCEAQTPYLIRPKKDAAKAEVNLIVHNVAVAASADRSVVADGYSFLGTFIGKTVNGNDGYYAFSANDGAFKLCNTSSGTKVPSFRAYVHADGGASKIAVVEGDTVDGIVNVAAGSNCEDIIYDLQGRRLTDKRSVNGVIVVNGKKVILK